jgi:flagellar export protein FliJ
VKRFEFRLQSVLNWRSRQLEIQESRLQALLGELAGLDAALGRIDAETREAEREAVASGDSQELASLDRFRARQRRERERVLAQRAACERRIREQRERVVEARRGVRLLERLRDRKLADWHATAAKELETVAAESFLSRWQREGLRERRA